MNTNCFLDDICNKEIVDKINKYKPKCGCYILGTTGPTGPTGPAGASGGTQVVSAHLVIL